MLKAVLIPAVVAAGVACVPVAQADPGQADLSQPFSQAGGPFTGTWTGHCETVTLDSERLRKHSG